MDNLDNQELVYMLANIAFCELVRDVYKSKVPDRALRVSAYAMRSYSLIEGCLL